MIESPHKEPSALRSLATLTFFVFIGTFISSLGFLFLKDYFSNLMVLKVLQILQSILIFILPAWFFAVYHKRNPLAFFKLNIRFPLILLFCVLAISLTFAPLMEFFITQNRNLSLPDFLKPLEQWMQEMEKNAEKLIKEFLKMRSQGDLIINMLMIAVLPALGEELLFRGCLQQIFTKWTKNYHWGIWIAAFIFSFIHLQFYGFIPRMLLGALFGYVFVWSGSLWPAIFGHFVNNATAVLASYLYQGRITTTGFDQERFFPGFTYFLSLIITVALLVVFYRIGRKFRQSVYGERLG